MSSSAPDSWIEVNLEDVVEIRDFERDPINATERSARLVGKSQSDLYPYYGATGQVGWIDAYRSAGQQVLLGEDGAPFLDPNRDKAYLVDGRYWVNNHAHVLRGLDGLMENRLLAHQLNIADYHPFVSGSTRLKLTSAAMKRMPLLLPPFNEQVRIIDKLEELLSDLDAGVAELKAAQRKLAQYRQTLLKAAVEGALTADWRAARAKAGKPQESGAELLQRILTERRARWETRQLAKFAEQGKAPPKDWLTKYKEPVAPNTTNLPALPEGWVWANLGQVIESLTSGSRDWAPYYDRGTCTFVMAQNVRPWRPDFSFKQLVDPPIGNRDRARSAVEKDDILVTIVGANTGHVCRVPEQLQDHFVCQSVGLIRLVHRESSEFVNAVLNSSGHGQRQFREMNYGAGRPHLSFEQLESVLVPLPCRSEQVEILERLEVALATTTNTEAQMLQAGRFTSAQRKIILRAAFAGQLVPQDPNDEPASALLARISAERAANPIATPKRARTHRTTA